MPPRVALSRSAALLARRLGITVLAVDRDPVEVTLALAAEVARPEAERARRVAACAELLARESTVRGVLGVLNAELAGVPVALLVDGGLVAGRAAALRSARGLTDVRVDVPGPAGGRWAELVAAVPEPSDGYAEYVPTLLRLARAPLLAASARRRIETARRTAREQAAFRLLRDSVEHRRAAAEEAPPAAGTRPPPYREPPVWTSELGWRVEGGQHGVVARRPRRRPGHAGTGADHDGTGGVGRATAGPATRRRPGRLAELVEPAA